MIYPTRRAVLIAAAAAAPAALIIAMIDPARWYIGLACPLAILLAMLVDAVTGVSPAAVQASLAAPAAAMIGETIAPVVEIRIARGDLRRAEAAVSADPLLAGADDGRLSLDIVDGAGSRAFAFHAVRRGLARLDRLWVRWEGRLGLVWKQKANMVDLAVPIFPDLRAIYDQAPRLLSNNLQIGNQAQVHRGDGSDYDSMVEYRSGMDRRTIDWKQSARHVKLHARDYRTDRNSQLVLAVDCGRQMAEPIGGVPRVDRAVSAALLAAWLGLKLDDRVALYAFDAKPRVASGLVTGTRAFAGLQRLAASIDYGEEEVNFTLGLTTLAARLARRSTVVLFTEFTDLTSADYLIRAAQQLMSRHLLLVAIFRDTELEEFVAAEPATADDVIRAVTASALLRERRLVLARLKHLGAHIVECEPDHVPEQLATAYLALKRRNLL
ncbi:DUF58 domain-containing protein [Sphingomonas sp.]|uniref:DUF58 domain-containing protein n=1 Tax=Sphingomonas sp. TaxID=28214 RepID=UPI000DB2F109|nr:DUF58 domain-containing protein [Sphingomonas sp.]PZU06599.1 MAG: DUF58 domain-containing protein [Sphingomonas sp.]